jgi:hypothetical protein
MIAFRQSLVNASHPQFMGLELSHTGVLSENKNRFSAEADDIKRASEIVQSTKSFAGFSGIDGF